MYDSIEYQSLLVIQLELIECLYKDYNRKLAM